jgi:uncharacterized repeat protein (TIGR03803 family)
MHQSAICALRRVFRRICFYAASVTSVASLLIAAAVPSSAQTYDVLYSFATATGANPIGQIASDKAGNIYGTTEEGGSSGVGTAFELSPPAIPGGAWTETVIYSFSGVDAGGYYPVGGITIDRLGNLYGTTTWGGGTRCNCGTVFKLEPPTAPGGAWRYRTLHHFEGWPSDGSDPQAPVTVDNSGNIYGTTYTGGLYYSSSAQTGGIVFKLSPQGSGWAETILWNFGQPGDASYPMSDLVSDSAGNYYGTSIVGGSSAVGAVFKLSPPAAGATAWTESVLYSFPLPGTEYGGWPTGSLLIDSHGNLFGTATGSVEVCCSSVFELSPPANGSAWTIKSLYTFTLTSASYGPVGLTKDSAAQHLYGVSSLFRYYPVLFELTQPAVAGDPWTYSQLHAFGVQDGEGPRTAPLLDASGYIYGTVAGGGKKGGEGAAYEIVP